MEDFYLGGITCPNCSDIQNPSGQSKFKMVKIDDYKVKCIYYFDKTIGSIKYLFSRNDL